MEIINSFYSENVFLDKLNAIFEQTNLAYYLNRSDLGNLEWELFTGASVSYQFNKQKLERFEEAIRISKVFGIISLAMLVILSLSYLTTYSFLYGYYFGGNSDSYSSNFEIIRWFIPFHYKTIAYTGIIISGSSALLMYIIYLITEKEWIKKIIAIVALCVFHVLLTYFFVAKLNFDSILNFSIIWTLPLSIAGSVLIAKTLIENPFKIISGFSVSIIVSFLVFIFFLTKINDQEETLEILLIVSFILSCLIVGKIPYKNTFLKLLFIIPPTTLFVIMLLGMFNIYFPLKNSVTITIWISGTVIISGISTFCFKDKMIDSKIQFPKLSDFLEIGQKMIPLLFLKNTQKITLVPIGLLVIGTYILIPRISVYVAENIRELTENNKRGIEKIVIKDALDNELVINGNVVSEQNGVLYISNERWELEQIKASYYYVK
ncbi:hypothetical protein FJQ98_19350 [Lysinibacillus agricola]|uniref:Uncharacterized protein n=1 Tax=Lysinibacillus agricola TaxID=2590012 RepID=A0ABX7ANE2_9BACI|nr:hypothetical protein [Lysinibacillus agricola]QQP11350.1 hypothetical protein FJQ98_19350 [Lysinibacillus agricola]